MKKVIVSVINDLFSDQRLEKVCGSLHEMGFEVFLVGRKRRNSPPLPQRPYRMHRMRLLFEKGPAFYAEYNIRLFFFLLQNRTNLLVSNDLDTLLPNFLAHKIFKTPLVYDSHEYFTETPEVVNRKFVKSVWAFIEKNIFPKLKHAITVCDSIAQVYNKKYGVDVKVVRNLPQLRYDNSPCDRKTLNLPEDKKILLMQGAGINIDRGAEELVKMMQYLDSYLLLFIGSGDVFNSLQDLALQNGSLEKVRFIPRIPQFELQKYTVCSDLGLAIDKDTNLNYRFALPNKIFEYIHAGIPLLVSPLIERKKIIDKYKVGFYLESFDPKEMANQIEAIFKNPEAIAECRKNTKFAARELCWENEETILKEIYQPYV